MITIRDVWPDFQLRGTGDKGLENLTGGGTVIV